MTSIVDALLALVPDAKSEIDFSFEDHLDGKGPQLVSWKHPTAPRPTMEQLNQAMADGRAESKRIERTSSKARLEARLGMSIADLKKLLSQ